jgi:O-antigen/teichoic acid export membrane protein
MTRWVALAAAPIAVTVVALRRELLSLYGPGFRDGAAALSVLALGHLVNATFGLSGWILTVSGRSRIVLVNNIVAAVVNVIMGLTLIPRFGLVGTALAALGSVTLLNLLVLVEVWHIHGVHPFNLSVPKPFLAAAVALAVELAIAGNVNPVALRIPLVIVAGLATYVLTFVALGLAQEDRRMLAGFAKRLRAWFGPR